MFVLLQAEDGIRDHCVTGVQRCALLFSSRRRHTRSLCDWSSDVISYAVFCLRSEEHTSELQSHSDLVCRLLLEKKRRNELSQGCGMSVRSRYIIRVRDLSVAKDVSGLVS